MRVLVPAAPVCLASALVLIGCGAPAAQSPNGAGITPIEKHVEEGTLVVSVMGYPRDIEYRVNGILIQPEEPIPWWTDARLELQLQSGTYRVEGTYRVRAFSGDKTTARVTTPTPVPIRTGETTYLLADLAKDWRGVPADDVTKFRIVDAATFTTHVAAARASTHTTPDTPGATAAPASAPEGVTILRGTPDGVDVETGPDASAGTTSIVIRGNEVLPPGSPPPPEIAPTSAVTAPQVSSDTLAADASGLPPAAGPEPQALLAPGASAPRTLAVRLDSAPAGARVFVDDGEVGVTPIEVRLEPTVDHVIRFVHAACSDHVRFLSAAGWEKGRSTRIVATLECE